MTGNVSNMDARNAPLLDLVADRSPRPPSRAGNVATSRASSSLRCDSAAAKRSQKDIQIASSWLAAYAAANEGGSMRIM